jgi:hypothetical protein
MFLLSILSDVAAALLLFLVCQLVGWTWTASAADGWRSRPRSAALLRLLSSFGIGLWIVSIGAMLWGMAVGLSFEKIAILWLALIAGGARSAGGLLNGYRSALAGLRWDGCSKAGLVLVALLGFAGLMFALVPPLFTDTVRYHLGVPAAWLRDGTIHELPRFSEQHLVMMWQNASLLLLGIDQPSAAKVFFFLAFPLTLAALGILVNARCGRAAAWFSIFMIGATPTFFGNSVLGGVDAGLAFFTAMALLFFFSPATTYDLRPTTYAWAGVMAGLAICTKWQGLALLPGLAAAALLERRRQGLRPAVRMAVLGLAMFLPWALRNFFWSGDPVYPFLARYFDSEAATAAARFGGLLSHYGLTGRPWWQYLLYPLHLTFAEQNFWFGGTIEFESWIGWMYLLMLPVLLVALKRDPAIRPLMAFGLICFVLGLAQGELPRFLMPAWVALAVASGWGWSRLSVCWRRIAAAVLAAISLWNLGTVTRALNQDGFAPLSYYRCGGADALYGRIHPEWRVSRWIAGRFVDKRVLLVGLDGGLFWTNPVTLDGPFDEKTLVEIARESAGPAEIAARLKARGIGLVVVDSGRAERLENQFGYMGWDGPTRKKIREFFLNRMTRVRRDGGIQVGTVE